jgi:hypothetical protein
MSEIDQQSGSVLNRDVARLQAEALRMARACRRVVQGCLREEEWRLADAEFESIILVGLSRLWKNNQK